MLVKLRHPAFQLLQGQLPASGLAPALLLTHAAFCLSAVQFALQLEYLEAAFYSCATTGAPLPANVTGSTTVITEGCARGNYTEETYDVFGEIAADELNHVKVSSLLCSCDNGAMTSSTLAPWPLLLKSSALADAQCIHAAQLLMRTQIPEPVALAHLQHRVACWPALMPATILPHADLPPVLPAVPPERSDCRWRHPRAPATAEPDFLDRGRPAGLPRHCAGVCLWWLHATVLCALMLHETALRLCCALIIQPATLTLGLLRPSLPLHSSNIANSQLIADCPAEPPLHVHHQRPVRLPGCLCV